MRLLLIRHGDPDYERDTLTEAGRREAELLAERAGELSFGTCFTSPLGRAKDTAKIAVRDLGLPLVEKTWLQEFNVGVNINPYPELQAAYPDTPSFQGLAPGSGRRCLMDDYRPEDYGAFLDPEGNPLPYRPRVPWDMLPEYYAAHPELAGENSWQKTLVAKAGKIEFYYDLVSKGLDDLLAEHGYVREGRLYRVEKASEETLTFFCHLGTISVLLAHLLNLSPLALPQVFAPAPTSVTEVVTEERRKGAAQFRCLRMGDLTHLALGGQKPSFSARFCECYENRDQRH